MGGIVGRALVPVLKMPGVYSALQVAHRAIDRANKWVRERMN